MLILFILLAIIIIAIGSLFTVNNHEECDIEDYNHEDVNGWKNE